MDSQIDEIDKDDVIVNHVIKDMKLTSRIRHDSIFRQKIILSLALFWLFFCLGWNVSQLGPALLDLQIITNTQLDEASYFLSSFNIGFLLGALSAGWIFKKIIPVRVFSVLSIVIAIATAITPWCLYFELMIIVFIFRGITHGIVDGGANIMILETWGVENGPYMQALHFCFAFGAIISPIATAPFFKTKEMTLNLTTDSNVLTYNGSSQQLYSFSTSSFDSTFNISTEITTQHFEYEERLYSKIHGAFVISAVLTAISCVYFSYLLFCKPTQTKEVNKSKSRLNRSMTRSLHLVTISFICAVYFCMNCLEKGMAFFLPTFTVEHLGWSKATGSYAVSAFWASFAFGRFIAIGIIKIFTAKRILGLYCSVLVLTSAGLLVTNVLKYEIGIWIFVPLCGLCQSVLFPQFFSWTEQDFFRVTGKIVSLFMFVGSVGSMLTPVILGYLIDMLTPMSFTYFVLILSVLLLLLYLIMVFLSRKIKYNVNEKELSVFVS